MNFPINIKTLFDSHTVHGVRRCENQIRFIANYEKTINNNKPYLSLTPTLCHKLIELELFELIELELLSSMSLSLTSGYLSSILNPPMFNDKIELSAFNFFFPTLRGGCEGRVL